MVDRPEELTRDHNISVLKVQYTTWTHSILVLGKKRLEKSRKMDEHEKNEAIEKKKWNTKMFDIRKFGSDTFLVTILKYYRSTGTTHLNLLMAEKADATKKQKKSSMSLLPDNNFLHLPPRRPPQSLGTASRRASSHPQPVGSAAGLCDHHNTGRGNGGGGVYS